MTQSKAWPQKTMVGYVTAYGSTTPPNVTNIMISNAIAQGYTVFVYAFGNISSTNTVTGPNSISASDLKTQIDNIHQNNGIALISFGGQNNTFLPNINDPQTAGINSAQFCTQNGFDGIDLDLESVAVDDTYLVSYINALRAQSSDLFITAAPQIGGGYGGSAALAPALFSTSFLNDAKFDALFIQEYNQFKGAVFDGLQDTDVGFISASFLPLTKIIPTDTKIVVGEPANTNAGTGLSNPADIVSDIQNGGIVLNNPQYGGVMVWAMNYDSAQGWTFVNGVKPVI
ncbi:glycosyl hydrolase family 18 protein [uncultured Shewanella sp.]|uniref:glycosyl hydrolase family 18 protein n=1 Tax=uncultured Shewanella sp. TaxID=173975 RepID=UPI002601E535|nr:glycosyl hydrolase family 18 protein [uncultured Shewanella sp.]